VRQRARDRGRKRREVALVRVGERRVAAEGVDGHDRADVARRGRVDGPAERVEIRRRAEAAVPDRAEDDRTHARLACEPHLGRGVAGLRRVLDGADDELRPAAASAAAGGEQREKKN
jgi:hypothetical protein